MIKEQGIQGWLEAEEVASKKLSGHKNMKKLAVILAGMLALGTAVLVASAGARAGQYYDDDNYHSRSDSHYEGRDYDRSPYYDRCKATIRATGLGNILPAIARVNAIYAWKREVRSVYGESADWSDARAKSIVCEGVGVTTRCTARARPCL